ncbi:MAG: hypothetical protein OXU23_03355 [Candidatus Poribacteria bacterium]|nr:hypothetical protein [Candidatus Poribacteria bacterium]
MADDNHITQPQTQTAIRTLIVAGYSIEGSRPQPRHIEILCTRTDILGATISYLVAVTDFDEYFETEIEDILHSASNQSRIPVIVAQRQYKKTISWGDFTEALGGAVPSWQALTPEYDQALVTTAKNNLPDGVTEGEAWLIFEDLVGYGLEFIFGRRVRRLGGRLRGRRVSDMQAQIPTGEVLIVDAKASADGFDVTWPNLRPIVEYAHRQQVRQGGQVELFGALISSSNFKQKDDRLIEISQEFFAEVRVPLSFIDTDVIVKTINLFQMRPDVRNGIRWNQIFKGGRVYFSMIKNELQAVDNERVKKGV